MRANNKVIVLNKIISIVQCVLGGMGLFVFGLGFLGNLLDVETSLDFASIILFILFISLNAYMLYCGIKRNKMGKKLKNYINMIGNVASVSIVEIALSVQASESQVVSEFEWLIKKNFLIDAYIDYDDKKLIFKEAYAKELEKQQQEEQAKRNIQYISVVCECCNGTTRIVKGKGGICDYCGAPIK